MNRKDVINVLKMENDLITFDPTTGEDIDVRCLNELNKKCYIAHEEAIEFLKQSIPVEWIEERLKRAVAFTHSKAEGNIINDGCVVTVVSASFTANVLLNLLEDWEKENENI